MLQLRFEKDAEKVINLGRDHGRVFDFWSIVHFLTGLLIGIISYITGLSFWSLFLITTILLIVYEGFEMFTGVIEDFWNSLIDIFIALFGFVILYCILLEAQVSMFFLIILFMIILGCILLLDFVGYQKYIKRVLHHKQDKEYVYISVSFFEILVFVIAFLVLLCIGHFDLASLIVGIGFVYLSYKYYLL